jgi:hypothetical protein
LSERSSRVRFGSETGGKACRRLHERSRSSISWFSDGGTDEIRSCERSRTLTVGRTGTSVRRLRVQQNVWRLFSDVTCGGIDPIWHCARKRYLIEPGRGATSTSGI